ncbi:MAG: DUF4102 domain-containing protein [Nostoc sp. NOS(2021)]|uniref:DUF4102 domain-containing protein n=1 Tax=Nostoc sp. NOS(2021) TaxID=2815407 RepID=UPI0025E4BC22|nr:DUF4102 domain-containing protein [Nostoc sp. NOS(2021)]MBN3897342.1 DUF4102 domain-containing protein [Nostoc sp. NOS(2021)]
MKHKADVPGQLTLLTVAPTVESRQSIDDPYWNEITAEKLVESDRWNPADFGEVPFKSEDDGQLTIFYDSQEPPDPDNYLNQEEFEQAWNQWETLVGGQVPKVTSQHTAELLVGEQVRLDTKKSAPQHDTHWVERYWVERSGNKYWYYRYCWMTGRKIHRDYIGAVRSRSAINLRQDVEIAISCGQSPPEIEKLIRSWKSRQKRSHF